MNRRGPGWGGGKNRQLKVRLGQKFPQIGNGGAQGNGAGLLHAGEQEIVRFA